MINLLLVGKRMLFYDMIQSVFAEQGMQYLGQTTDPDVAAHYYRCCSPDIVLLDAHWHKSQPPLEHLVKAILTSDSAARIILVSTFFDAHIFQHAPQLGAKGYFQRNTPQPASIVDCILAVYNGGTMFCS